MAQATLLDDFADAIDFDDPDQLYGAMKAKIKATCLERLEWNERSLSKLQSVQEMNLRDDVIPNREAWESTVDFMTSKIGTEQSKLRDTIQTLRGPSTMQQWLYWQYATPEHYAFKATMSEMSTYFVPGQVAETHLRMEDVAALQHAIERRYGSQASADLIHDTYTILYKQHFLDSAVQSAAHCRRKYGVEKQKTTPCNNLQCGDVLLFWRLQKMMQSSGSILRLEAMDYKRQVEETVRTVVDDVVQEEEAKYDLIQGPRVELAEEIEVVRMMQSKLEAFITAAKDERR